MAKYENAKDMTTDSWKLYRSGVDYNTRLSYYDNTTRNLRFYNGNQWIGVPAGNLNKPVFNIFKRVINYFISSILSQSVKGRYSVENVPDLQEGEMIDPNTKEQEMRDLADLLSSHADLRWERDKMDTKLRRLLLDGATSGDFACYVYWDANKETGQDAKGDFITEVVDGGNVFFGNPNTSEVEKQPYILIAGRELVTKLREEAKANGAKEEEVASIMPDEETEYQVGDGGKIELEKNGAEVGKCLFILKFWKQDGVVWFSKSTKNVEIRKAVNMDIRRYPVAWGNWEMVKNSYHGQAVGTGLIDNQIYINKQFAMTMLWLMNMAYGKVAYDTTRISGWSNQVNAAIPVQGDITGAVQQLQPGQMSSVVLQMIDKAIAYTKEMLGATDAGLGDVRPENTSAIIAVQKAATIPLQMVQANLYQFVEDIFLIWAEFILRKYNANRTISYMGKQGVLTKTVNTANFRDLIMNVKIDVGASTYWSEIASLQTLDNLLMNGHLDIVQYLERVPNGIIEKKQELIDNIKIRMEQQAMMQQQPQPQPQPIEQPKPPPPDNTAIFEQMAQFMKSLPMETQQQLQSLPPDQMEQMVLQMMQGG